MSGGVDSAVAALLVRARAAPRRSAVTLELWSDPENDGERSCCSAQAVRGARELAHGLGMPHLSIDLRAEFRAGVVDPWLADHAAGLTPNPCVRCNGNVRLDAMLELAERLGAQTLATGHYARVVERAAALRRCCGWRPTRARTRATCWRRSRPSRSRGCASRSGRCARPQVRELAERAGLAVARQARLAGSVLPRGHPPAAPSSSVTAASATRPGAIVDRDGTRARRARAAHTSSPSASATASASAAREPLYVLAHRRAREHGHGRPARRSCCAAAVRCARSTLHRDGECVDGVKRALARAAARRAGWPASRAPGATRASSVELERAGGAHGAGPDRVPVRGRCDRRLRHHRGVASPHRSPRLEHRPKIIAR